MTALINLIKGFRKTGQAARLILLLFLLNFLFSLFLAVPMYHSLQASFGESLAGDVMVEKFDYLWWEEYRDQGEGLEKTFSPAIIGCGALLKNLENLVHMKFLSLPPLVLIFGIVYIFFHTFLAGGILAVLNPERPSFSMRLFFENAGRYFFYFAGYLIISWGLFFLIASSLGNGFEGIVRHFARSADSEILPFFVQLFFSLVIFFLILFIHMLFDYARIKTVQTRTRSVFTNTFSAVKFVFKNPGSTLGLYYSVFLAGIILSFLYILISSLIHQTSFFGIAAGFFIQQMFILGIIWIRCWLYASELELHKYLT